MKKPIEFITTGDGHELILNPAAKRVLEEIQKPAEVVSVVGLYRTGKSYLLNRLMGRSDGFPLGNKIQAQTKGIWLWVGDHPRDRSKALVLLDTEGLSDPGKGDKEHDAKLFMVSILLSSILVYNSKNTIDDHALETLNLVTKLTEHIQQTTQHKDQDDEDDLKMIFPTLVWAVRDHFLELEIDGRKVTSNEYLEDCLKMKKGVKPAVKKHNDLREPIRSLFRSRHCFVFPQPTRDLLNLDKIPYEELDPDFQQAGTRFINFVFNQNGCKIVKGNKISTSVLASLAEQYIGSINKNTPVIIDSAFDMVMKAKNSRALEAAVGLYRGEMGRVKLPTSSAALNTAGREVGRPTGTITWPSPRTTGRTSLSRS